MRPKTKFIESEYLVSRFNDAITDRFKVKDIKNLAWNTADTMHYPSEMGSIIRRKRAIHIVEYYP